MPDIININITTPPPTPVEVQVMQARDAYMIAVAEGYVGTRAEWVAALPGTDGTNGTNGTDGPQAVVYANLAAYLAAPVETQMDGNFHLIPIA